MSAFQYLKLDFFQNMSVCKMKKKKNEEEAESKKEKEKARKKKKRVKIQNGLEENESEK